MKRYGNLLNEETVTKELCEQAILDASENKQKRRIVRRILKKIEVYADKLRAMVLEGTYKPAKYWIETINERGKEREITKPRFWPDQCIHHILILLPGEKFFNRIDPHACGSIKSRGISLAAKLLKRWVVGESINTRFCGKGDVRKCYPSLKPKILYREIRRYFKDENYLELWRKVLFSHPYLALGNYTSALCLNLIFKPLDELIANYPGVTHSIRYIDDICFFAKKKRVLHSLMRKISVFLEEYYEVQLKGNWAVFKVSSGLDEHHREVDGRAVDMVGYKFTHSGVSIRKRNWKRLRRDALRLTNKKPTEKRSRSFLSRMGMTKIVNTNTIFRKTISHVNIKKVKRVASQNI